MQLNDYQSLIYSISLNTLASVAFTFGVNSLVNIPGSDFLITGIIAYVNGETGGSDRIRIILEPVIKTIF